MARRDYSSEFRRRVLSLIAAGRPIREIASDLGVSEQTIHTWQRQDRIDQGLASAECAELFVARKRVRGRCQGMSRSRLNFEPSVAGSQAS